MLKFDWEKGTITAEDGETRTACEDEHAFESIFRLVLWAYEKGLVAGFEPMRLLMEQCRDKSRPCAPFAPQAMLAERLDALIREARDNSRRKCKRNKEKQWKLSKL